MALKRIIALGLLLMILAQIAYSNSNYDQFIYRSEKQEGWFQKYVRKYFQDTLFDGSYAIVIAVGDYDNLPRLESAQHDAEKMTEFLLNTAEYDEVVMLTDADATFNTIRYFMEEYFPKKMKQGRYRFLFYFSGHGAQREGYGDTIIGFLQLKGATREPTTQSINMRHIESWAMQLPYAAHMLFLVDACFSGLAGTQDKSYETHVDPVELARESGRFMMTAGGADETSIASLSRWGGSLFTDVVIHGMTGAADFNQDDVVTTYELFTYTQAAVKLEAQKARHTQHPLISNLGRYTDKGQYFFVYQDPTRPELEAGAAPDDVQQKDDRLQAEIERVLQECERHFQANRLTTGQGGTALNCYQQVLALDPANAEALTGLDRIEAQYVEWAQQALQEGRHDNARQYLERLRIVNPESPALADLQDALQPPTPEPPTPQPLRSEPRTVAPDEAQEVFGLTTREFDWGTSNWAPATYIENQYEDQGDVVVDHATGLMWQKSGSESWLTYSEAQDYIENLNRQKFAGYSDWRLPTIPELMSLLEPEEQSNDRYINPIFDSEQIWCWSADRRIKGEISAGAAWFVDFRSGYVDWNLLYTHFVRGVRS